MTTRCDHTDLPIDQCGGPCHRPDLEAPPEKPARWVGSDTEARYPGTCAHCGDRFDAGARIVAADVAGTGASEEWCLYDHTRTAAGWGR